MTERLYYTDPYRRSFDATVVRVGDRDGRPAVFLDSTAFYPTSGGQPFDTGTLGGLPVVDVVDEDDGAIAHIVTTASGPPAVGQTVHGEIDWARRFDHMQQHSGQHVLSAAFDRLFHVRTVSFHLGSDVSTIDLAREVTPSEIAAAEDAANQIVWEDRPVHVRYATREEAAAMPLRKEPKREGTLRLIDVEGWDLSACGGTHVKQSGGIGVIVVSSWERFKGGQRLEFLCGGRAVRRYRSNRDALGDATRLLSVLPQELPAAIERLQSDAREHKRTAALRQTELARYHAVELAASAEVAGELRLVLKAIDADAAGLKSLAAAITSAPGFFVVLVSTSSPALAVVARSSDVSVSAQSVLATLTGRFGGRGGGKPDLAQGGGLSGTSQEILDAARQAAR
ncbi:MAG TPA: alanyl-tRNA editing protein [Vicinamibacterales bacterium]|jgi:alanyl-tRNA synthetase